MKDIESALEILNEDDECKMVLLSSSGPCFSEGLDLSYVLDELYVERILKANELIKAVG